MSNSSHQLIVVTGAAGNQGGATARHLLSHGWKVRALTRDVNKPAAQTLAGAELFTADNDDRASLDTAFKGAYGVFSVQTYWLPNVSAEGEVRQGEAIADAAQARAFNTLCMPRSARRIAVWGRPTFPASTKSNSISSRSTCPTPSCGL